MAHNYLQKLYEAGYIDEPVSKGPSAVKESIRAIKIKERLIRIHSTIQSEGNFLFPELFYSGPEELHPHLTAGDQAWSDFITDNRTKETISPSTSRRSISSFIKKHPGKLLLGSAAAIWLASEFSGWDDYYNTIPGMNEMGLAAQQRKILTDFGSGWSWKKLPANIMKAGFNFIKGATFDPERRLAAGIPLLAGITVGLFDSSLGIGAGLGTAAGAELGYFKGGIRSGYKGAILGALGGTATSWVTSTLGGGFAPAFAAGIGTSVISSISMAALMKGGLGLRSQLKETMTTIGTLSGESSVFGKEAIERFESLLGPRGLAFSFKKDVPEAFKKAKAWRKAQELEKAGKLRYKQEIEALPKIPVANFEEFQKNLPKYSDFVTPAVMPMDAGLDISNILGTVIGLRPEFQRLEFIGKAVEKFPRLAHFMDATFGSPALGNVAEKFGGLGAAPGGAIFKAIGQDILEGIPMGLGFAGIGYLFSDSLPKKGEASNSFDGMPHGGLAASLRKQNTEFGSKYDSVRALSRMLGETFESFTKSKGFREALTEAKFVKTLGEGTFGETHLMEAQVRGETFQFAKKELHPGIREKIFSKDVADPTKWTGSLNLQHEASMMHPFGMSEAIPSVYHATERELYMEYMPGLTLEQLYKSGGQLPSSAREIMAKTIQEVAHKDIINTDINLGNIIFNPSSGRIAWIDFGQATSNKIRSKRELVEEMSTKVTPYLTPRDQLATSTRNLRVKALQKITAITIPTNPAHGSKIEGMQHGGMAHRKRRSNTPFGSGWRGIFGGLSRSVKKFWAKGALKGTDKLLDPRRAAKMAHSSTLEEFAQKLGGDVRILGKEPIIGTSEEAIKRRAFEQAAISTGGGAGALPGGTVYIHPETLKKRAIEKAASMGIDKKLTQQVVESDNFLKTMLYHEHLESQAMQRFGTQMKMTGRGARHQAGQVIFGEAGFVKTLQDKNLERFLHQMRGTKIEKTTFEAGLEAFQEDCVASPLRKLLSDFGSGYRGLNNTTSIEVSRVLASQHGRAAAKLTESSKDLKIAQEQVWEWANHAGQGHSRYTGEHVKQLSRFGGNI